jgi:hypothetical protein
MYLPRSLSILEELLIQMPSRQVDKNVVGRCGCANREVVAHPKLGLKEINWKMERKARRVY